MSWATLTDISWTARGSSWTAAFQEFGGTASSGTFQIDKPRLRRGQEDKQVLTPIIESILRVRIKDNSRTIHSKLRSTPFHLLRILIKKGGSEWGSYIVYRLDGGDEITYDNPVLRLRCTGGLHKLKRIQWNKKGRVELLRALEHIISKADAQFPVRVYTEWRGENANLTSRGETQAIQVPLGDIGQATPSTSYFDALKQLCFCFNLQVIQYNGRWHIIQRSFRNEDMTWEQRTPAQNESTGTFDPRITQSQSNLLSWEDNFPEGDSRRAVYSISRRFYYNQEPWKNADFSETYADLSGTTHFTGWSDDGTINQSSGGNPKITTSTDFVEQSFDKPIGPGAEKDDKATLTAEVKITTEGSGSKDVVQVPVLEVVRRRKRDGNVGAEYWNEQGWSGSQKAIVANDVDVPASGTKTTTFNFDQLPDITAHSLNNHELLVRCTTDVDPDGDNTDEVISVEYINVEGNLEKNATDPDGENFYVVSGDGQIQREVSIGAWDPDNQASGMVKFWNGSAWDKSESWTYDAQQTLQSALGKAGATEIEKQRNHDLAEIQAAVSYDGVKIIESPKIDGKRYIPAHSDEILTHERRYMELIEYKNS